MSLTDADVTEGESDDGDGLLQVPRAGKYGTLWAWNSGGMASKAERIWLRVENDMVMGSVCT